MRSSRGFRRLCILLAALLLFEPLLFALRPVPPVQAQTAAEPAPSGRGQVVLDGPKGTHVNTFNGNLYYSRTDMTLPGCEGGLSLTFSYNSFQASWPSPFGYGWQFQYSIFYFEDEQTGDVSIVWGDGGQEHFIHQGGGTFLAPTASRDTLVRTQVLPERKYELTTGDQVTYYFDAARHRRVTKIEQPNGRAVLFSYDGEGKLTTMTDAYGRQLQLGYTDGYLTSVANTNVTPPRLIHYGYDAAGNLTSVADPMGFTTSYAYDANHALVNVTDAENNSVSIGYADDRVAGLSTALSTVYFSYDDFEDGSSRRTVMEMVGEEGLKTTYDYDDRGRVTGVTDPLGGITRNSWDDQDNLISVTDPLSHTTRYGYDERGNQIWATDALSQTTWYTYHPTLDLPVAVTDARGNTGYWEYDQYGNVTRMTDPLGEDTVYTYDDCGCHLVAVTDPLSNTTQYGYDQWGNLAVITNALGYTTTLTYNAAGELLARTDANGHTTALEYDANGRLLSVTDPLTRTVRQYYDDVGNLTEWVDPLDNGLTYEYDELGRLVRVLDAMNGLTKYGYDAQGSLIAVTDANQNTTSFAYDAVGRPVEERDPLGNTWRYEYDLAGNLIGRIDANGATTNYIHDELDRLVLVDYPDGSDVTYQYDPNGNVTFEANANAEVSYAYDELDRLIAKTVHVLDSGFTKTIGYTYDAADRRETMVDPDGGVTTYEYDSVGQLITLTNPLAEVYSFAYDPAGQRVRKYLANGTYATYQYDAAGQLTFLGNYRSSGEVIASFAYQYDLAGNRVRKAHEDGGVEVYIYDPLYRLTEAVYSDGSFERFGYDPVGNRLSHEDDEGITVYSYDFADRLLTAGDVTYGWDDNGNMTVKDQDGEAWGYAYDHESRLVSIVLPDDSTSIFRYYPDGTQVSETAADGDFTSYVTDGPNVLEEIIFNGERQTRYTSVGVDEWLSAYHDAMTDFFHRDGLGSTVALTDSGGELSGTMSYLAFGEFKTHAGQLGSRYLYTGRQWDEQSQLFNYRSRYYDSDVGRFISRDPRRGHIALPSTLHLYTYVRNNPGNFIDPTGETPAIIVILGGAAAIYLITKSGVALKSWLDTYERTLELGEEKNEALDKCLFGGGDDAACQEAMRLEAEWRESFVETGQKGVEWAETVPGKSLDLMPPPTGWVDLVIEGLQSLAVEILDLLGFMGGHPESEAEAPPSPGNEPRPPDDNYSAATSRTQAEVPTLRVHPQVAVLWNGFAQEAGDFLNSLGEPYAIAGLDFLPDIVDQTPILVIPSAGLHGQENSSIFRTKLAQYVDRGGTIIAFTQPRGTQFDALPGGEVSGYGYTEDVSCFSNAMYVAEYHPVLSGVGQCSVTAHVDGYLSTWPDDGKLLLARTKNTAGGLVLYPYGDGWVAVTGMYDDWGAGNWQASTGAKVVVRDLISWGVDPAGLSTTEYRPGDAVSVDVPLHNGTGTMAHSARLRLISPAREMVSESSQAINLPPGETATIPLATTAAVPLGIWWVDYTLLDAAGQVIQSQAAGARFVVSQPPGECGPEDEILLSVTAPYWTVLQGQPAEFTAHVVNSTAEPVTVTVAAERNHEGSMVLGTVGLEPGEGHDFPYDMTFNSRSALWTYVCANPTCGWSSGRNWLAVEHNAVDVATPSVAVDIEAGQPTYRAGDTVVISGTLENLAGAEYLVYAQLQVFNPSHELVYQDSAPYLLPAGGPVQILETFVLPETPVYGFYTARMEVTAEGEMVGVGTAYFEMPAASLYIDPVEPDLYLPGQVNTVAFTIENVGGDDVQDGELTVTLFDPAGAERWSQSQTVNISQTETITPSFAVVFPAGLGVFRLTCVVVFGGKSAWTEVEIPATHQVQITPHELKYSGGDSLTFDIWIANTGVFQEDGLAVTTQVPAAGYSRLDTIALGPGQGINISHAVTLPLTIAGGVYPMGVELALGEGSQSFAGQFVVLPAYMDLQLVQGTWEAGGALQVQMTNTGGGMTAYDGELRLRDLRGLRMSTELVNGTLMVGETTVLTVPIPAGAANASYHLTAEIMAADTGNTFRLNRLLSISGLAASMRAFTDQEMYHITDPITATAVLTNTGAYPITGAPVGLQVVPMGGTGSVVGVVSDLDGHPVPAAAVRLDSNALSYTTLAGEFRFGALGIGTHELAVRRPGYHLYLDEIFVGGPQTPVEVYLVPAAYGEISGTLRISGTQEIVVGGELVLEPADVQASDARAMRVRSRWDGMYGFPRVPTGVYTFTVQMLGQPPFVQALTVSEGLNVVDIWLDKGGQMRLQHTVVEFDADPAGSAPVRLGRSRAPR